MDTKPIYKSKTVIGLLLIIVGEALSKATTLPEAIGPIVAVAGLVLALVGRFLADKPLSIGK